MSMADSMKIGQKYWVRYRIPGVHRVDRTLIAQFLGDGGHGMLSFSGRPQFGITEIDERWIMVTREVANYAECHVDRKVS